MPVCTTKAAAGLVCAAAFLFSGGAVPQTTSSEVPAGANSGREKPTAEEAARGRRLYTSFCARCHGINMISPGSSFFDLREYPLDQRERFYKAVIDGVRAMPAWGPTLNPDEINAIWAYVVSHQVK